MTLSQCYAFLEIESTATDEEAKSAYRRKAKLFHPDLNDNNSGQFLNLQFAYETIINARNIHSKLNVFDEIFLKENYFKASDTQLQHFQRLERRYRARKIILLKKQKQQKVINDVYDKYRFTWRFPLVLFYVFIATFLLVLLVYDFNAQVVSKSFHLVSKENLNYNISEFTDNFIIVENEKFYVSKDFYMSTQKSDSIIINKTPIFNIYKTLQISGIGWDKFETIHSFINEAFILVLLLLFVPFLSMFFMKPNFIFVFVFVQYNFYVLPVLISYVLFVDYRIIALLKYFKFFQS
ncbi:MAG: DnaJ domain-containing protein [Bacteroidales bacterium]|nr:DnaJ domain-containing protein [Bacteroidales bacterium]